MRAWLSKLRSVGLPHPHRPARLDATGPATRYAAQAGAYRPPHNQPTVLLDSRPLMTRLARQRACSR